jgi:hypothetical protein
VDDNYYYCISITLNDEIVCYLVTNCKCGNFVFSKVHTVVGFIKAISWVRVGEFLFLCPLMSE